MKLQITLSILLIFCAVSAEAQREISTDRPDRTEAAANLDDETLQIEGGLGLTTYGHSDAEFKQFNVVVPEVLVRLGTTDELELRLSGNMTRRDLESQPDCLTDSCPSITVTDYIPTVGFGMKAPVYDDRDFKMGSMLTLSAEFGPDETSFAIEGRSTFWGEISDVFDLGVNLGVVIPVSLEKSLLRQDEPTAIYSAVLGFGLSDEIGLYVEVFGEGVSFSFDLIPVTANTGVTYLVNNDFQLDFSVVAGITEIGPDAGAGIGASWRFEFD